MAQPRATLARLVELAQSAGVSYAGLRREELLARLAATVADSAPHATAPLRLCSLDMGYRQFAHAQLRIEGAGKPPVLERWEKVPVNIPEPYDPRTFSESMRAFVAQLTARDDGRDGMRVVYLVERQSFRGCGGRMAIPGGIMMLNRIEAGLHVLLAPRDVRAVDPRMVARTLGLDERGPAKKRSAVRLVKAMLSQPLVDSGSGADNSNGCSQKGEQVHESVAGIINGIGPTVPNALKTFFMGERKQDDLADALLQAVAYLAWQQRISTMRSLVAL